MKHAALFVFLCSAALIPLLTQPSYAALSYTCDPNIDTAHAGTCAYLNATIAPLYNSTFTNANASIYVKYGVTGLGQSQYSFSFVTYSAYVAAVTANSQSSGNRVQASAVNALNSIDAGVYGSYMVAVNSALGKALQFQFNPGTTASGGSCSAPGTGSCYDGVIIITNDPGAHLYFRTGTEPANAYDFYGVVEHETDEVLGTASCVDTTQSPLSNGCAAPLNTSVLAPVDLFRYQSAGKLVLIDGTPGAYFSYDGGQTNGANGKLYNTLANGDDYADFVSSKPCQTQQSIQDAVGCPGFDANRDITNDGGAEINILNAIGYKLAGQTTTPPPATPSISNIQNSATFQTSQALAPGTYLAIFGSNLSTDGTGRTWAGPDFVSDGSGNLKIPTALDGTSVTVGSLPAYVYYVSATQLNIVTPTTIAPGSNVQVVVTVKNGAGSASSTPFSVTLTNLAPSFFAYYPGTVNDGKYLIAQHLTNPPTDVGPVGLYPTASANFTTPAKPRETIQLYGTGFGPTSPVIPVGIETPLSPTFSLSPNPTATVGGLDANVVFAGLTPTLSLVYQFDVTIPPNAPNGDLPLVVTVNGVKSFSGLITVQGP